MKKCDVIAVLTAFAAAAAAAPAFAQALPGEGFFIGGGLGQSHVNETFSGGTVASTGLPYSISGADQNKTTLGFMAGYQFDETWGIQFMYTDLGKRSGTINYNGASGSTGDIKAYQWGVAGTATFPIADQWFAKGLLGVSENHLDGFSTTVGGVNFSAGSKNHTDLMAGIAAGYQWNKNFSTRLEYDYFGKFEVSGASGSAKGSNIGLRMQYNF